MWCNEYQIDSEDLFIKSFIKYFIFKFVLILFFNK